LEFGKLLSDTTKRKRLVVASAAMLLVVIVCAAVGLGGDIPPLTVFALIMLAGGLGVLGKLLISVMVHLHGAAGRLKELNERYDETERWLEQFDRGTRTALKSMGKSQGELKSKAGAIEKSLQDLQRSVDSFATREALEASIKSSSTSSAKLQESVGKFGKRIDQITGESKDLSRAVQDMQNSRELIETVSDELAAKIEKLQDSIGEQDKLRHTELQSAQNTSKQQIESVGKQVNKDIVALKKSVQTSSALASRLRGDGYVRFTRLVGVEFVEKIKGDIGSKLGLTVEQSQIRYLERKVQQIEAVCEGRLATTSEDAVARVLAARACQTDKLKVLEIGVLFGIGAAFMHTALVSFYNKVELFLLDPFDGYYGTENLDPLTGQAITRSAVERNMKRAAIDPTDVHYLEGLSTDDSILKQAKAAGPFDVLVIDGDHSYDGVKADFERYAEFVVEDGILIVDDYGSEDWPEVTRYVNEIVSKDERFDEVGILSRTAIFKRNSNGPAAPKKKSATKKIPSKSKTGSPTGQSGESAAGISGKIAKKVASKKASKKIGKKSTTKRKTSASKKPSKTLAQEIAGEQVSVESATDSA
jgi:predicted O-methyltransferase YrrM/predicted  nucleic acid-binding Zn-ribbon protein